MKKQPIIGRKQEQLTLKQCIETESAQFIALYGRRRVGKTYLIKRFFDDKFDFYMSGVYKLSMSEQLSIFSDQLKLYFNKDFQSPKTWFEAFNMLRDELKRLRKRTWIVFLDELPWMDTPKSNFIRALEAFWNMWGADQPKLKLIVCGSATSWMLNKLLGDKGGLHNRVTRRIHLHPFNLSETECFLKYIGINWDRLQILQCYMILGGTPFYLNMLNKNESLSQNIDRLFYGKQGELREEYDFLFRSLFKETVIYKKIVELLASKMKGMTRQEIVDKLGDYDSGKLSEKLENLRQCDFLSTYSAFGKKERDVMYQLSDLYVLFYLRFIKNYHGLNQRAWTEMKDQHKSTWYGYAYEQVAFHHVNQIKWALGIAGVASDIYSWQYYPKNREDKGAQIDMIIQRADHVTNICEIKYSIGKYELKADYLDYMIERKEFFVDKTKNADTIHFTIITTKGVKDNRYSGYINSTIVLDDLFRE